ncbi:hypothetical protein NKG05_20460 [Oerskovia sp. M15]
MTTARADSAPLSSAAPTTADRVRQVTVLVGAAIAIVGAAFGSGAFGGQAVQNASGEPSPPTPPLSLPTVRRSRSGP